MSLETDFNATKDQILLNRTAQGLVKAARDIYNENPATPNHANRLAWANTITGANAALAITEQQAMTWVIANPTISSNYADDGQAAITDNDLLFVVSSEVLPRLIPTT